MGGMFIFLLILIVFGIGMYLLYQKGYIPYTQNHLNRLKKHIDEIVDEIEKKYYDPGKDLFTDIIFLEQKFKSMNNLFIFNMNLKEDTIQRYKKRLSYLVTTILNHHVADLSDLNLCNINEIDTTQRARLFPGFHAMINNFQNVQKFFNRRNELYNACYHITHQELEESNLISCYNDITTLANNITFCDPEDFYAEFPEFKKILYDLEFSS